jgi:hypothetical protein
MKENNLTKQQLAQKRNYFKYVLTGMLKPVDINCLGPAELSAWNEIQLIKKHVLDQFDWNSKQLGLKVPEHRCWCGKEGKYNSAKAGKYVCKKHLEF